MITQPALKQDISSSKMSKELIEDVFNKALQDDSDIKYFTLDIRLDFSDITEFSKNFDFSIRKFYTLLAEDNQKELCVILEKISYFILNYKDTYFEGDIVLYQTTSGSYKNAHVGQYWKIILLGACLYNNHDFIFELLERNGSLNIMSLAPSYSMNRGIYANYISENRSSIKKTIEKAIEKQQPFYRYLCEIMQISLDQAADSEYDPDFLKFLLETERYLNKNHNSLPSLRLDNSIIHMIRYIKNVSGLPLLKYIFTQYKQHLNLVKEWNDICLPDPINPEAWYFIGGTFHNNISLPTYYAAHPNEGYDEFLKFLVLEAKLNLEACKSQVKSDSTVVNPSYHPISQDYILSWAMLGPLLIKHNLSPEILLERTLPKIFFLLNQGCYFDHLYENLFRIFLKDVKEKKIDDKWITVCQSFFNILKRCGRLLDLAQLKRVHNPKEQEEIELILKTLKTGVNGRLAESGNKTALQYALENNHMELANQLRNAGAHNDIQYFRGSSLACDAINRTASSASAASLPAASNSLMFSNHTTTHDVKSQKESMELQSTTLPAVNAYTPVSDCANPGLRKRKRNKINSADF